MVVVAGGIGAVDIVRFAQQPEILPVQQWMLTPRPESPGQAGRTWLNPKASEQERAFRDQQRQQAEERHDLRLERRLDADSAWSRTGRDGPGGDKVGSAQIMHTLKVFEVLVTHRR